MYKRQVLRIVKRRMCVKRSKPVKFPTNRNFHGSLEHRQRGGTLQRMGLQRRLRGTTVYDRHQLGVLIDLT